MTVPANDISLNRKLAIELFEMVWALLDKKERTAHEDEQLVYAAHASRYHWSVAGTVKEWSIGEWQISRVYSVLNRPEPAIHHAQRAMEMARDNAVGAFFVAYGYEALARSHAVARHNDEAGRYLRLARELASQIPEAENRKMLTDDLATIILKPAIP